MATFSITDTGCGIPPEDKPRLFEPYFSTKKSGTGLGLAIVATIISDHNGYIRVKDNYPKGTRFIIELPINGNSPLRPDACSSRIRIRPESNEKHSDYR